MRDELPLTEYHAVKVEDKYEIGLLLQILPNMPPEANHLKRIKDGLILIQPANIPLHQVVFFNFSVVGFNKKYLITLEFVR